MLEDALHGSSLNARGVTIFLVGTGDLTQAIAHALAITDVDRNRRCRIVIAGRNVVRLEWLLASTAMRVKAVGTSWEVSSAIIDWESGASLEETLAKYRPTLVVQLSTLQSPWTLTGNDRWSALVREVGFGITAPLQGKLLLQTLRAMRSSGTSAPLVNACYPDFVNVMMGAMGHDVACGVGNISILAAMISAEISTKLQLRMLATVRHVFDAIYRTVSQDRAPLVWDGERRLASDEVVQLIPTFPFQRDSNLLTSATALPVLLALSGLRQPWRGHVPAPDALPGGYPVIVTDGAIALDLPNDISVDEAIRWSRESVSRDGVMLRNAHVVFAERAREQLASISMVFADGFSLESYDDAVSELLKIRDHLIQVS